MEELAALRQPVESPPKPPPLPEAGGSEEEPVETPRIAVIGTRGGVGATSVAANLAWLLAEETKLKTALIDLDLWFGTVALSLDIEPTRGLREALENPARIDSLFVSSATAKRPRSSPIMNSCFSSSSAWSL